MPPEEFLSLDAIEELELLQRTIHKNAQAKGFWPLGSLPQDHSDELITARLGLIMCEVAEAIEAFRNGNPDSEKIPPVSSVEEELVDAIIRIMDVAEAMGFKAIFDSLAMKLEYNALRPKMHGKKI